MKTKKNNKLELAIDAKFSKFIARITKKLIQEYRENQELSIITKITRIVYQKN